MRISVTRQYKLPLVTPLFGGGAKAGSPDEQMPIRGSVIRGQLRFWWRLLYRAQFLRDSQLDVVAMRAHEAEIWDSPAQPSAVQVRVEAERLGNGDFRADDRFAFETLSPETYALF